MKLKEIKPGMVIHCKTEEQCLALFDELKRNGYVWADGAELSEYSISFDVYFGETCYTIGEDKRITFSDTGYHESILDFITEFSDLIIPEVSLGEVLQITYEICNEYSNDAMDCSKDCPFCHNKFCKEWMAEHPEEVVEICTKWKSEHKKTELEVEWIYELCLETPFSDSYDVAETEEEAIKKCEEALKNEKYTKVSYKKVCRAKERSNT